MNATEDHRPAAYAKKQSPFFSPGSVLALCGLACLVIVSIPLGLLIVVIGIILDIATSPKYICTACGNALQKTSQLCPVCRATILKRKGSGFASALFLALILTTAAIFAAILLLQRLAP